MNPPPSADSPGPRQGLIDWYRFLERPRLAPLESVSLERLRGASILVTGAAGSIGSALSLRLAALHPRKLILLDASEHALYRLQPAVRSAASDSQAKLILGNAGDPALMDEIFSEHSPELVFHAAAYKHVPLLEEQPLEALANNALATLTLAQRAERSGVARIVLLSTDKAAAPVSILGASKRIAERVVLARQGVALRLGNVLGTAGSVSEAFARQIDAGAPLTLTTPHAQRYFLTLEEAVDLLFAAALAAPPGALLAPKLPRQHRIAGLASFLLSARAPASAPPIEFVGARPGDKDSEVFWSGDEIPLAESAQASFELRRDSAPSLRSHPDLEQLESAHFERNLPRAIDAVVRLVPGYAPSPAIAARLRESATGVLQP